MATRHVATVHVANLSPAIHAEMLRSIFGHFGTITDIRLVSSGGPAPYAFVDYSTDAAAEAAMSMSGQEFDGRRLRVERAKRSEYPPPPKLPAETRAGEAINPAAELYVGNLAFSTSAEAIRAYFATFGHVIDVQIVRDRQTGQPRGFAFVKFSDPRDANSAIAKAPHLLDGRTINVAASNLARGEGVVATPPPVAGTAVAPPSARDDALLGPLPVRVKAEVPDQRPYRRDSDSGRGGRSLSPEHDKYLDGGRGKRVGSDASYASNSKRSRFSDEPVPKADGDKVAIIVEKLFDGTAKLNEYAAKVQADTRETCAAFGEVLSIEIPVQSIEAAQPVYVEFFQAAHAAAAAENVASRTYDGRQLAVRRVTRRELRAEIDARRQSASSGGKGRRTSLEKNSLHLEEEIEDLRRQLQRARSELKDVDSKKDAEKARLRADLAHHSAQHKLLQSRVDELEDELDKARTSARKDREFHAARVKALTDRAHTLEADRERS